MKPIPLAKPIIGRQERKAVIRVLKSGNLAQGTEVKAFEEEFSKVVEGRDCVAVNSGTSALHLALLSLNIGPGHEVIVPSFTFAATANSVALTGAKPIFVDIEPLTFNIDPIEIEKAVTKNTRAIQVVHLYGLPANMPDIIKIAKKYNLLIIEDAAQAHGANIQGKPVGTFGDAAAFSFYPTKNMTTGEGGMIVFADEIATKKARLLRNQGMEKRYTNEIVGFNLRMTEFQAAIGRIQLKKLSTWNKTRQENAYFYSNNLQNVLTPHITPGYEHVFHQYTIRIKKERDQVQDFLRAQKISCEVYYPTQVHKLPSFECDMELPQTLAATKEVLSLPIRPDLSSRELNFIVRILEEATKR